MKTVIIDEATGKIKAVLSGPKKNHTIGNFQIAIEYNGDTRNKIGQEVDGTWQLVDDVESIIEGERTVKLKEITSFKEQKIEEGFSFTGEKVNSGAWEPATVSIPYSGAVFSRIKLVADRKAQAATTLFRNGKVVINLPNKEKIELTSDTGLQNFINDYFGNLDQVIAAEAEKIQELLLLETVEEIRAYPVETGWE